MAERVAGSSKLTVLCLVAGVLALGMGLAMPDVAASAAKKEERPNIVLVLTDDQPFEALEHMPFVSGRSDWISFDNAFLNNPICCPSRATILNGRYSHLNRVETNFDGRKFRDRSTIATWLKRAGYKTGFFGKYLNGYPWGRRSGDYVPPGWNRWLAFKRGPAYFDYTLNKRGEAGGPARADERGSSERAYSTDVFGKAARRFIGRSAAGPDPFFAFVSFFAPHGPLIPAPRHENAFQQTPITQPPNFNEADVSDKPQWVQELPIRDLAEMEEGRRSQYRLLLSVDEAVEGIFDELSERGELENTIVVFLSDNGFLWGEHRDTGKACGFEECVRTPLLIRGPGLDQRREDALVSNIDVAPTLARLAGVVPPEEVDGKGIGKLLRGERDRVHRSVLLRGKQADPPFNGNQPPSFWGVRTDRFKYIETEETGERELYDLRNDPFELSNVVDSPAYANAAEDLANRLDSLRNG
jgi:arylsulfatase A-like enzyme